MVVTVVNALLRYTRAGRRRQCSLLTTSKLIFPTSLKDGVGTSPILGTQIRSWFLVLKRQVHALILVRSIGRGAVSMPFIWNGVAILRGLGSMHLSCFGPGMNV